MEQPIIIVPVNRETLPLLVQLEQQTFRETFGRNYDPEDLHTFLQEKKSTEALANELTQPGTTFFMLYCEHTPAGFLKLNLHKQPDSTPPLPEPVMELEKIYVLQAFQGKKFGHTLIQHALQQASAQQVKTLWLGVWEHNNKAIQFYRKQGFEQFGAHSFRIGKQTDTDWLMKKTL